MNKKSVLFVCLGNICRSPLAEVIFLRHLKANNIESNFELDSAGTGGWHIGQAAHHESIRVASQNSLNLAFHRARQVQAQDFQQYDYIVAMDNSNYEDLLALCSNQQIRAKICRIREFDIDTSDLNVPDPYFGGPDGFDLVFEMLDRCCKNLLDRIVNETS